MGAGGGGGFTDGFGGPGSGFGDMGSSSVSGMDPLRSQSVANSAAMDFGRVPSPDIGPMDGFTDPGVSPRDFGMTPRSRTGMGSRDTFAPPRSSPVPDFSRGLPSPPPAPVMTDRMPDARVGMGSSARASVPRSTDPSVDFSDAMSFGTTGRLPAPRPSAELVRPTSTRRSMGGRDMRGGSPCGAMGMPAGPCIMFPYPRCGPGFR